MVKTTNKSYLVVILGILSAIGPFSIDMYLPGFEEIAKDLSTSSSNVALTLTTYFFGIAFGQLLYGPIMDRFGRRLPLLIGILIYILASIGCAVSQSIEMLIFLRLIQAIGACSGMVASTAVLTDIFDFEDIAKALSRMLLVMGAAPIVAPMVGGVLIQWFDWRAMFYFLAIFASLILLLLFLLLPETKGSDKNIKLRPLDILRSYFVVFKNKDFLYFALGGNIAMTVMFAYVASSSYVFMNFYGLSETGFSYVFGIGALGFVTGSQLNRWALTKMQMLKLVLLSSSVQSIISFVILLLVIFIKEIPIYVVMAGLFLILFMLGFINPNATAVSLNPFKQHGGSASALHGFTRMAMGSVVAAIMSVIQDGTPLPMFLVIFILALLGNILLRFGINKKR